MKTFVLENDVYLRKGASKNAGVIALLRKGQSVKIDDIVIAGGFLWGVQPRDVGGKGYVAMGEVKVYGSLK